MINANYDDYDDDLLRHYYEKELEFLRRDMRAFAQRHPGAAARLSINSDGYSDDPGVERLMQSTALLHARHSAKIDDDYPEITEAVTRMSYPQYLRPFPSCSVAQFDIGGLFDGQSKPVQIARGTELLTTTVGCRFRTAYDVVLAPLRIARAQYVCTPAAPASVRLPPDTSGMLSVTFCAATPGGRLDAAIPASVRVHLAGPPPTVAALIDTMLLRTTTAYVEDDTGRWQRLPVIPVTAVGFGPQDWLFTDAKESGQPFGLLGEYFAFTERFHFVDIDFGALRAAAPGGQLTLHLAVERVPPSSWTAQRLAQLCADHLKLFCTPVVNLFSKKGVTLRYDSQAGVWPIEVQDKGDTLTEVWSIDQVRTERGKPLHSSATFMAGQADWSDPRWTFMQRRRPESPETGRPAALGLVGVDGPIESETGIGSLRADVICSNGDLPRSVCPGAPGGDIRMEGNAPVAGKIALLSVPTAVTQLARTDGELWRLICQQIPQPVRLDQDGLAELKQILLQFGTLSPAQAPHIDGITGLRHRSVMALIVRPPQPAMVRGIEITLAIDEHLFAANSVAVFAGVMERFFAPYAHANSYVQLIVISLNGLVLWQGKPVTGTMPLL